MATRMDTWAIEDLFLLADFIDEKPENFWFLVYYQVLEHDSETAKELAKKSLKYHTETVNSLRAIKEIKSRITGIKRIMVKATKSSKKG